MIHGQVLTYAGVAEYSVAAPRNKTKQVSGTKVRDYVGDQLEIESYLSYSAYFTYCLIPSPSTAAPGRLFALSQWPSH